MSNAYMVNFIYNVWALYKWQKNIEKLFDNTKQGKKLHN